MRLGFKAGCFGVFKCLSGYCARNEKKYALSNQQDIQTLNYRYNEKQFNNNDMLQLPGFVIYYLSFFPQIKQVFISSLNKVLNAQSFSNKHELTTHEYQDSISIQYLQTSNAFMST